MSIATLLELAEETHPERIAVTCGRRSLACAHLRSAAQAVAGLVRRGRWRHVVLRDANSLALPVALFGAAYAGVPLVAIDERLAGDELAARLASLAPALLVTGDVAPEALPVVPVVPVMPVVPVVSVVPGVAVLAREAFLAASRELPAELVAACARAVEPAVLCLRAGEGSEPEALHHEELLARVLAEVTLGAAGEDDTALVAVPPASGASALAILRSVGAGRRIVLQDRFEAGAWLDLCRRERASESWLEPSMLASVVARLERSGQAADLPALRTIVCGDEAAAPALIERARVVLPAATVVAADHAASA